MCIYTYIVDMEAIMSFDKEELLLRTSEFYKVLSDYSRFKIVYALLDKELSVNEIMEEVGLSQTATSYQLKILRANHLVKYVRKGQKVLYRIDDEHVAMAVKIAMEHISHN